MDLLKHKRSIFLLIVLDIIFAFILEFDFTAKEYWYVNLFKYAAVCVCFLMAAALFKHAHSREDAKLLLLGLLFTLVSDAFLLFSTAPELGIVTFMFAHLCYIKRFRPQLFQSFLTVTFLVTAICFGAAVIGLKLPYFYMLGSMYAALILAATLSAFRSKLPKPNKILVCTGMALFIMCDINVAIQFIAPAGSALAAATFPLIYLFYIPSQACLALSAGEYCAVSPC